MNSALVTTVCKDIKELRRLYDASFPDDERIPFDRVLSSLSQDRVMKAYYDENDLVGLTVVFLCDDLAYLSYICVEENIRHKGYGSQIIEYIKEEYKDYRIVLDIEEIIKDSDNYIERVKRKEFYLNNGFKESGVFYYFYHVNYELLVWNGEIFKEDWQKIIEKHWGKIAKKAIYKTK